MSKNRAAIVTGGGGYLGKYFINGLSNNYSTVYVVDKNPVSKDILKEFSNISLIFHELDISKEKEVIQLFKSIEDDDSESIVTTLLNAAANNPKIISIFLKFTFVPRRNHCNFRPYRKTLSLDLCSHLERGLRE